VARPVKLPTSKKPVEFVASSLDDLRSLPKEVRIVFGYAILMAELGKDTRTQSH
jgi:phage-related protein